MSETLETCPICSMNFKAERGWSVPGKLFCHRTCRDAYVAALTNSEALAQIAWHIESTSPPPRPDAWPEKECHVCGTIEEPWSFIADKPVCSYQCAVKQLARGVRELERAREDGPRSTLGPGW